MFGMNLLYFCTEFLRKNMENYQETKINNFDVEELEQRYEIKWSWHTSTDSPGGTFYF